MKYNITHMPSQTQLTFNDVREPNQLFAAAIKDGFIEVQEETKRTNELLFFSSGQSVLQYIETTAVSPFLILCDVNIPKMDGFELKNRLLQSDSMYHKSIPFVFWSSQASSEQIKKAYDLRVNGFFLKENNMNDLKTSLTTIVQYWRKSKVPE